MDFGDIDFANVDDKDVFEELQSAADLIDRVANLSDSIGAVVNTVHPLRAPADHDISYSTPEMPFTVFVSVPRAGERDVTLRVAEALIHESMHLQLTLLDWVIPLTVGSAAHGYSPWKREQRPILGLIHGLYVFAVIRQALDAIQAFGDLAKRYGEARIARIRSEVAALPPRPTGLSAFGSELWNRCVHAVEY